MTLAYSENHEALIINSLRVQNAVYNIKARATCSNHCALKDKVHNNLHNSHQLIKFIRYSATRLMQFSQNAHHVNSVKRSRLLTPAYLTTSTILQTGICENCIAVPARNTQI
jgi:hypothetical protein